MMIDDDATGNDDDVDDRDDDIDDHGDQGSNKAFWQDQVLNPSEQLPRLLCKPLYCKPFYVQSLLLLLGSDTTPVLLLDTLYIAYHVSTICSAFQARLCHWRGLVHQMRLWPPPPSTDPPSSPSKLPSTRSVPSIREPRYPLLLSERVQEIDLGYS